VIIRLTSNLPPASSHPSNFAPIPPPPPFATMSAPVAQWTPSQPSLSGSVNDRRVAAYQSHRQQVPTRAVPDFNSRPSNSTRITQRRPRHAFPATVASSSTASPVQIVYFDVLLYPYPVSQPYIIFDSEHVTSAYSAC